MSLMLLVLLSVDADAEPSVRHQSSLQSEENDEIFCVNCVPCARSEPWPPLDLNPGFDKPSPAHTSDVRIVAPWIPNEVEPLPDRILGVFPKTLLLKREKKNPRSSLSSQLP